MQNAVDCMYGPRELSDKERGVRHMAIWIALFNGYDAIPTSAG